MNRIVRFPADLYSSMQDKNKVQKALSILTQYGWDPGIEMCCINKDYDSLACMVTIRAITDFFLAGNLPVFKLDK